MNFQVVATFFVGLLAVNVSFQSPSLKDDSAKTVIVEILNKVLNISTTVLNDVNAVVDLVEQDQNGAKDRIVEFYVRMGKEVNSMVMKAIDALKTGATDAGKAIIDCIEGEQGKTEDAFTKVYGDIGTCAVGEAPKVLTEVKAILSQLIDLKNDVQSKTDILSSCSKDELTCLLGFLSTVLETARKIPSIVMTDIKEVIHLIITIVGDVNGCSGEVVKEIGSDVQGIFNDAVLCIRKS